MARYFPFTIRQVAGILELKTRYDNKENGNMDTDCPFCKEKSKLNLNAAKNVFRCNFCGENGGMVELYGKMLGISNACAYREIYELLGCGKPNPASYDKPATEQPNAPGTVSRAGSDAMYQTYSMLLSMLSLAQPHKEQLLAKGMTQAQIESHGYKSVPAFGQRLLCTKLLQSGCILKGVPGFYRDNGKWDVKLKAPGIIIPIRGIDGKIAGIQIRLAKPINGRKYIWMSSPGLDGGASSGSPIHFIGDPAAKRVFVTDGALKGATAHCLTGYTFICLPGAMNLGGIDGLLSCLKGNGTAEAHEAFDIKKLTDKQLGASAAKLREKLHAHGFKVTSAIWEDATLCGVDDYFLHRTNSERSKIIAAVSAPPKQLFPSIAGFFPAHENDTAAAAAV